MDEILPIRRKHYTINLFENVYRVWHKITFITIKGFKFQTCVTEILHIYKNQLMKIWMGALKVIYLENLPWLTVKEWLTCIDDLVSFIYLEISISLEFFFERWPYNITMSFSDNTVCRLRLRPLGLLVIVLFVFNGVNLCHLYNR